MTPDQAIVLAAHPAAKINWSRAAVEVRDGAVILGQVKMRFRAPMRELEDGAWADAAARITREAK